MTCAGLPWAGLTWAGSAPLRSEFQELLDELCGLDGTLELTSVIRSIDDPESGVVADGAGKPSPEGDKLLVAFAGEHEYGHLELSQTSPQRCLASRSAEPQRRSKARRFVLHPRTHEPRASRQAVEERPFEPAVEEALEPSSVSRHLVELACEKLVGADPGVALGTVVDPAGDSDEHRSSDHPRTLQSCVQKDSAAERVADVVGLPAGLRDELRGLPEVGAYLRRPPMPRKVHCVYEVGLSEDLLEPTPRVRVLGEPVEKSQIRARTGSVDVELIDTTLRADRTTICHEL